MYTLETTVHDYVPSGKYNMLHLGNNKPVTGELLHKKMCRIPYHIQPKYWAIFYQKKSKVVRSFLLYLTERDLAMWNPVDVNALLNFLKFKITKWT